MSILRDFGVDTWFTGVPLMLRTGEAVRAFSFRLEPISIIILSHIECEFVSDQPFADIHIFVSVGKMRIISIYSRIRVSY